MLDLVWIHHARPRSAWYGLSEQDRSRHRSRWAEVHQTSLQAGAQHLGEFSVRGYSDYSTAEVWLFPSPDDAFDHWARLTSAHYAEWFTSANTVGFRSEVADD